MNDQNKQNVNGLAQDQCLSLHQGSDKNPDPLAAITYSGFIALVGRPNVGKSTLLNRLLQRKISITSRKAQTTRYQIVGIKNLQRGDKRCQCIYLDTPGFNGQIQNELQNYLVQVTKHALQDADLVVWVVAGSKFTKQDALVGRLATETGKPIIAVINKQDLLTGQRQALADQQQRLRSWLGVSALVMLSTKYAQGITVLEEQLVQMLPAGHGYYEPGQYTDRDEQFWAAEVVREKLMRLFGDELPYAAVVMTDKFIKRPATRTRPAIVTIQVTIYVERLGQKVILIGQQGQAIKRVGSLARAELEKSLGCRVMLRLWVKLKSNWTQDVQLLRSLGLSC